jgi:RNA polymerase sigma-70 factor, ECF subfamily
VVLQELSEVRYRYWQSVLDAWIHQVLFAAYSDPLHTTSLGDSSSSMHITSIHQDYSAFDYFVQQYERIILNYLWRMVGDEQTAFDLTQDTFLRAWQNFAKIRTYDRPKSWLFRVATNLAINHRKRRSSMEITIEDFANDEHGPASSDHGRSVAEVEQVRQILQSLSPKRRAVLILREVYGLNNEEIAQTLEMTFDAVKASLYRAREQFKELYLQSEGLSE